MKRLLSISDFILDKTNTSKYFSEREAWSVFRLAAFGEAIGWTLLISGISIKYFFMPWNNNPVLIAGQIHGTLFLIYFVSVLVFFSSLHWTRRQTLIAAIASIPPYGTLIFGKWMAHKRKKVALKSFRQIVVRAIIISNHELLVVQPRDSSFWCLPGGRVADSEKIEDALRRILKEQFNKDLKIGELLFMYEYKHRGNDRVEFFFNILNSDVIKKNEFTKYIKTSLEYEEMSFIKDFKEMDLEPEFIKKIDLKSNLNKNVTNVRIFTN